MAIYERKNKTDQDAATKNAEPAPPTTSTDTTTSSSEPKVKTDEKNGPDLAALNANGPGTDEAKQRAGVTGTGTGEGEYVVAEGKSVTSQRGILGPGTTVSPKDFAAGQEGLDAHLAAGTLVRKGEQRREPETKPEPTGDR